MYMYMSSTPTSSWGTSSRDCYVKKDYWCNTHFLEQESVVPARTQGSSSYTRVSCGLRQSALIGNPRCRRINGYYKSFHREERSWGGRGQDRVCRCLGWGEEEEEEEEEECIPICEVGGEVQEILNLLIEDRCRRGCGAFNRRMLPESRAPRVGLGGGKSFMGESYCAERTVWVDRPCYGGKTDVGKGWDKFVRCERKEADGKQGRSKESLFNEEVMQSNSRSKVSFTGWRSRIRWISSLELDKEEERVEKGVERGVSGKSLDQLKGSVRWASGVGKGKYEERVQEGSKRTVVEKSWSKSRSNVRWDSAVDSQKEEEIVQEGNKKFGSGILSNGVGRSKVQFKETVHKATQTSNSDKSLSNWRDNMELSSTAGSNKQEEVEQERATKSGLKVYSNDLSNVSRFSIQEQKGRISLEKGENSVASFMTHENSRDQMVQRERGPCVPLVHSVCSGKISEQRSVTKSEERERVENSTEKMVAQQQDKVHAREQLENTLQRNKSEMFPGMPSDDSKKIAMQSSFTKLEAQETVKRTKEKLAFQKQDELTKSNGRTSIVELNKEKYQAEQNLETASQRFGTLMASNRTSEKLSKDWVSSGRSEVFSTGATGGKKASSVDYGKGNGASQHLFETSSYTPVYSELTQSGTGRNHSIRITEKTNRTSEDLFQTTSKTEVERLKSPADDEKGSKVSPKLPSDPSYKLSSNEVLQVSMESNKKKYTSETETDTTSGKSAQTRLSYESNYSSGMVSAEGTDNHGSTEKISQESPLESRKPYLSSGDFPSEGPSEEVWAVAGWSSREEFEELQSSEKKKEEDSKILASEEPSDELQKSTEQQPIFESNKGQAATSKQNGKVIVKRRPSRGIWNSLIDFCGKGWGSHEESESSALKSSSGRPSTESPDSEGWFSVPELEDGECSMKEKADQDKRKIAAKRQGSVLISEAGENTAGGLKEAEKTQKEEVQKSAGKWSLEGSLEESQLTRRHISSTGHGGHGWQERKEERTDVSVDPKKSQGRQQAKVQKAAINWSSEGISADEIQLSTGPLSSGVDEKLDQIEKEKGKAAMVGKDELEEHEDTQRLIQSSEIEEKKKMTKQIKRNKQIPKETYTVWEEALIFESQQRQEDEKFMREALSEARMASDAWEVPIGAVLVQNGKIIARAHNLVEETRDATAHAEMLCIRYASNQLRTWRLAETTLYVTLEPCPMCAGAILQARIGTVVWGAPNKLLGADGSWVSLFPREHDEKLHGTSERPHATGPIHPFHPNIKIRRGVLASDCSDIMQQFFKLRRKREKKTQSNSCFSLKNYPSKLFTKLHEIFSVFCL